MRSVIDALESILPVGQGKGLTLSEMVRKSGKSKEWVRMRLRALHAAGLLVSERKFISAIDGRPVSVPAYTIRPIKKTQAKKAK